MARHLLNRKFPSCDSLVIDISTAPKEEDINIYILIHNSSWRENIFLKISPQINREMV